MIKAVVFDLDNTIYNYDECHIVAMKQLEEYVCDKYGVNKVDFRKNFELAKVEVKNCLETREHHIIGCYICRFFLKNKSISRRGCIRVI